MGHPRDRDQALEQHAWTHEQWELSLTSQRERKRCAAVSKHGVLEEDGHIGLLVMRVGPLTEGGEQRVGVQLPEGQSHDHALTDLLADGTCGKVGATAGAA
jgi:hypothetical protein